MRGPKDRDGYTPLMLSIMRKSPESPELVEALLSNGVDVNHHNHNNVTALHVACAAGSLDIGN